MFVPATATATASATTTTTTNQKDYFMTALLRNFFNQVLYHNSCAHVVDIPTLLMLKHITCVLEINLYPDLRHYKLKQAHKTFFVSD